MEISELGKRWLYAHGGRTVGSCNQDNNGFYVIMSTGKNGTERVYIPSDDEILAYFK